MRSSRPAVFLALAGVVLSAGVASALTPKPTPKPVCNLIVDKAGDASVLGPDPSDASLDILSADVASNAKHLTAVLRVRNLSASSLAATGRNYYVQFSTPTAKNPIYLSYETTPYGNYSSWGALERGAGGVGSYTYEGDATATVNKAKNEIRVTVPIGKLAALARLKPGAKITKLHANTSAGFVVLVSDVDEADSTKTYIAGAPSCVKPGR